MTPTRRPSKYTAKRANAILNSMREGLSLRAAAKANGVSHGTFLEWCDNDPNLADQYTRARERLLDIQAEELEEIGKKAATAKSAVKIAGLRLQSDNRKWLLSKLGSKKYGDKQQIDHGVTGSLESLIRDSMAPPDDQQQ